MPFTIRPLTTDDTLPFGDGRCPANLDTHLASSTEPTDAYRRLNEILIEKYGATTIAALDGDRVAAFVSFFPTWCEHADFCSDEQIEASLAHEEQLSVRPECDDPALHVRCLMVRPEYRGNGLAVRLLEALKAWASANGWHKIVGNGCIFSGRAEFQWLVSPKPPKPIWERAGFVVADYAPLNLAARSDAASSQATFDWYRSADFPTHLPKDIADDDPDWRDIFADYTMVCDLQVP